MLNGGKFNAYTQNSLLAKTAIMAMLLKNILLTLNIALSPFQHSFLKEKRIILSLIQKFGEMCITIFLDCVSHLDLLL